MLEQTVDKVSEKNNSKSIGLPVVSICILIFFQIINMNETSAALKYTLFPVIAACFLMIVSLKMHFKMKELVIISLFAVFAIVSTFESNVVSWTYITSSFVIMVIVFILMTSHDWSVAEAKQIIKFYTFMCIVISLIMLICSATNYMVVSGRVSINILGIRKDENYLSAFLVPGFTYFIYGFFLRNEKRMLFFIYAITVFTAVFLTGSRGALISMVIVVAIIMLKVIICEKLSTKKILLCIFSLLAIVMGFIALMNSSLGDRMFNADNYTTNIRLKIWGYAMEGFYKNPIIGSGIQAGTYYSQLSVRWYTHSCFIDMLTGQGLIGCLLYIALLFDFIRVKKGNIVFIISMIIVCFLPLAFINGYETLTFWVPMIVCCILSRICKKDYCIKTLY